MAKVETVDRFNITCEVGVGELGEAMVHIAKFPALRVVGSELVTDVRTYNNKSPPGASTALLKSWITDHPTFKAIEAVRYFEENGKTKGSTYPALATLVEEGVLKKLAPGSYSRTDVKQLAAPKKPRVAKGPPKTFDKRGEDVVLTFARRNHGRFNTTKLIEVFEAEGRARNSVYASINSVVKDKLAKRVGDPGSGQYVLLAKAIAKKAPAKKKPKVNGADVPSVMEAFHGE